LAKGGFADNMQKIDAAVRRETLYIAAWVLIFSAVMNGVFLLLGAWDTTVLAGSLVGAAAAVLNFFLMGLTVQKALGKPEKEAAELVRLSQTLRMFMLLAIAAVVCLVPAFHIVASLVPLLFPRIAIMLRPLFNRWMEPTTEGGEEKNNE